MSKFEIEFDAKKLEKQLNKQVDGIVRKKQKEIMIQHNKEKVSMNVLGQNEEEILTVLLEKYNKNKNYSVSGEYEEFPERIQFSIKDNFETLKLYGLISTYIPSLNGWNVILTPEALQYFEKKGCRLELFEELVNSEKDLLRNIINIENENGDITTFLKEKLENDEKNINRGIIGTLNKNGLIKVSWADDTIYYAVLTQAGRSYFEREKQYYEKLERLSSKNIYNNVNATGSTVFMGDVINSNLSINNSVLKVEQEIEEKCNNEEDKQELQKLLEETKEIIENIQDSKYIEKRKVFLQKLTKHLDKHGWFYAEIVNLLGQTVLTLLGGN